MTRALYWLGIFALSALVAHLAHVLISPRQEARSMMLQVQQRMGANAFHPLSGEVLRRFVGHPLAEAAYGACLLDVQETPVALKGPDLRSLWALTVYSPRGDVIYAITDRHLPPGPLDIRFEYRELDRASGEIALPRLRGKTMVVPLAVKQALLLLEAWPWHPGQAPMLQQRMKALTCAAQPGAARPAAGKAGVPVPRARPQRGKTGEKAP